MNSRLSPPTVPQGSETTIFPYESWLARSEEDGETVRELVPSDIITEKLLRDGTLKTTETEVEDALESRSHTHTYRYSHIHTHTHIQTDAHTLGTDEGP